MKKVAFLLDGFQVNGGIGRVTAIIANQLCQQDDYEVHTIAYVHRELEFLYPLSASIHYHSLYRRPISMTKAILVKNAIGKLNTIIREKEIDVLIACGALYFPVAVQACKGEKTQLICWEHTNPNTGNDYRFQRLARSYGAKHSCCNVVLTKRAQEFYDRHYPKAKNLQIYNPLDEKVQEKAGAYKLESKKIISVGRLSYPKYFQMAVEIAAEILPMRPDWQWDIYGEGEERQELEQLIAEKGLAEQMHLMGQVNDLYDRYGDYAIMVMTSRYEGFPMSLLEGMGNGLPLVSFDIDTGPDEIIRDGENGYLIPAFDKKKMCSQIIQLMEAPELRSDMSEKNRQSCRDFAQETILTQWKNLMDSIE